MKELESIDASELKSGFSGHSYVFDHPRAVEDIVGIVKFGLSASDRDLRTKQLDAKRYWQIFDKD
jgi:hypothetical protein